ncbi:MAG TPA: hypothetical protein VIL63_06370 [Terriglobales bacterium]
MPITHPQADFVNLVSSEIVTGIDRAVEYWLARIERELENAGMTSIERVHAVENILREYKNLTGKTDLLCASA